MFGLLAALLPACGGTAAPRAAQITCHTTYRPSVTVPIESEGSVVIPGDIDAEYEAPESGDLRLQARYWTGAADGERALQLLVTPAGAAEPLLTHLYQLPQDSGPQNQFAGGHGFTGLIYVYHPTSGAELQFWCEAAE